MEDISIVSKDVCDKDSQTLIMELNIILTEISVSAQTVESCSPWRSTRLMSPDSVSGLPMAII